MAQSSSRPRRAGRPRQPIPRGTLLAVACSAFAEKGYAGASMGEIAERAGLRKASLFHHFRSKALLYTEVLAETLGDLGQLVSAVQGDAGEFLERLDRLSDQVTAYLGGNPEAARLLIRELVDSGPFSTREGSEIVQASLAGVAGLLASGMESGAIPRQDPLQLAWSMVGLHLLWFAAPHVLRHAMHGGIFDPENIESRSRATRA
ncbi:MAG: TetR/AcrR family transcriptional regulator, partial [Myxococcota bacterium]|nr:TetR/AcrR family transcriptional regulator [Myxococcota bacterium]